MSPIQILKLVGFATGAALHFYIGWLIWNRRLGSGKRATQPETLINVLNLCLAIWFLGNLLITLHDLLFRGQLMFLLRAWETLAMTGVALLPAALLHAHIGVSASMDNYSRWSEKSIARAGWLLYLPMLFLPYALYRINSGQYLPFLLKLPRWMLIPYSFWYVMALWASAWLDLRIRDRIDSQATREKTFFSRLAVLLVLNAVFEFVVVAVLRSGPNDAAWVAFVLSSLFPIFFVAYHVYRYKFVDVVVKDSLVYAVFALLFIAVYTFGVRKLDQFLVDRFDITPGVIEVILILGMVALASPLVRTIDRAVHRLFTREIGLYRDVVRQLSSGAEGFGELASLIRYAEDTIQRGLKVISVRIIALTGDEKSPERKIADRMLEWGVDVLEDRDELQGVGATIAYALRREGELIGLMMIEAEPHSLSSEKRAILDVLAGQVAIEIESLKLVEDKVRLERELASRERLATLGQMAAQVAHEVKNPLSSIKSIVQVMREESAAEPFDRDLKLIVNEIDRLNRTVSQLLSFSRPSRAESRSVPLSELLDQTVAFARAEANDRGVSLAVESNGEVVLAGGEAGALREALSNLVLNGVQACDPGCTVTITARSGPGLTLEVTDDGAGIPEASQGKVFEPFYSTKSRGTGLGLAIVQRRIVELGGTLELTSPLASGRGTRFRLTLPRESLKNKTER